MVARFWQVWIVISEAFFSARVPRNFHKAVSAPRDFLQKAVRAPRDFHKVSVDSTDLLIG